MMDGPGMMGSPNLASMMLWMPIGMLVVVIVVVAVIWLVMRWLKQRDATVALPRTQPWEASPSYEQGYRARQPFSETVQERAWRDQGPQPKQEDEQPLLELEYPVLRE
jgi:hypothetical protein